MIPERGHQRMKIEVVRSGEARPLLHIQETSLHHEDEDDYVDNDNDNDENDDEDGYIIYHD